MNEFPKGWETASLGDVCNLPTQRVPSDDEEFIYIDIASVDRVLKTVSAPQKLLGAGAPSRARKIVNTGDVIVSMTRPNLNAVALINERHNNCIASTGFDVLKPSEIDPKWIFATVRSAQFVEAMREKVQGALYPAVNSADIREHKIRIPPHAEQTRIVRKLDELLSQVDTLKSRVDTIPTLLKRFRQSVLAAAVSGRLTNDKVDLKLPSGWQLVDFSSVINDLRYGTSKKCDYNGGKLGVLRIPNIGDNGICLNDLKSSNFSPTEIAKMALKKGDLLLIRSNGSVELVGKSAVVGHREEGLLFAGYLIRLRLNTEKVIPAYVDFWLKSPIVRQTIELTAKSTSGVNNINTEEIKSLSFTLPPHSIQAEIVRRVEQLFAFADQLEAKVVSAKSRIDDLTQSILAKAFRGELVPQDPNDEPASVLLERIKAQRESEPKVKRNRKASS